ncbi:MAG: nucleotidyl transferase AbiEii/AbiGii toxin family protein [Candidatus Peregrinibacteria bacterium]
MNILTKKLKVIVDDLKKEGRSGMVIINALKENLQYPVLDFIYNNSSYANLVMYGGTLLRIGYGLPRMSEDLDFQTDKQFDFEKFKNDLVAHFKKNYGVDVEVDIRKKIGKQTETAYLKFPLLKELESGHPWEKLRIRFDVNYFSAASDFASEIIPVTKDTYSFSIKTYTRDVLMASKVSAVFQRGKRGIGDDVADCKPRDIYDLIWYMEKKIIPNLDYIRAKGIEVKNIIDLFDKLSLKVPNLDDRLFQKDLMPFFYDPTEYETWHANWRSRFQMLRNSYQIYRVKKLESIHFGIDHSSDNRFFIFLFETDEPEKVIKFVCSLSEYWFLFSEKISGHRQKNIESRVVVSRPLKDLDYEYVGLFYTKIEDYLRRNDGIVTQATLQTKLIKMTGDNLNVKTQIMLDRRLLEKSKLEDLM